jgi:hypothetical protein
MFKQIQYETELLESLDWDDQKLKELFDYLKVEMNAKIIKHPKQIISEVKENFSYETSSIVKKILLEVAISNNLHIIKADNIDN